MMRSLLVSLIVLSLAGCGDRSAPKSGDSGRVKPVSEAAFEQAVLESKQPVLVDFWAPWCGPCKLLAPTVEEIAAEYEGKLKVVKVNIDDAPEVSGRFNISSIPALVLYRDGKVMDRKIGVQPKDELTAWLDDRLAKK